MFNSTYRQGAFNPSRKPGEGGVLREVFEATPFYIFVAAVMTAIRQRQNR
ncbi:MAG: hypothetical protein ACR2GP_04860 [Burkholderiaceae bacterium]